MKVNNGQYTMKALADRIFAIEDELTQYWLDNGKVGITDEAVQLDFRTRIEEASFGRNTVRYDNNGQPSILVKFLPDEKSKLSYLFGDSTAGIHPAFIIDGVAKPWYRGKYQMGRVGGTNYPVCLRGLEPWYTITYTAAQLAVTDKGNGYGLPTLQMEAFIALAAARNGFDIGGNTQYGRFYYGQDEIGVAAGYYSGNNYLHTLGGSGPLSWSHDGTPFGCFDIVGNTWTWTGAMRTVNGEIQTFPNNNGAGSLRTPTAHGAGSASWKAIDVDGNLVNPEASLSLWADSTSYVENEAIMHNGVRYVALNDHTSDSTTEPGVGGAWETDWVRKGTLHYAYVNSVVVMTDHAEGLSDTSRSIVFGNLTADIPVPTIAYALGLFPKYPGQRGYLYVRDAERLPIRGGNYESTNDAGPAALFLGNGRSSSSSTRGAGLAYNGS